MSVENVMARIAELHQGLVSPVTAAPAAGTAGATAFASVLQGQATSSAGLAGAGGTATALGFSGAAGTAAAAAARGPATAGARALQFAQAEIGQAEQPPGSNDSPRIAE